MADEQTQSQDDAAQTSDATQNTETQTQAAAKTFTQDELNAILTKRLARERDSWKAELDAERQKEQMTAEERLKADLDAERSKAQTAEERAKQREIKAEAKAQAADLGIKSEHFGDLLKLADLSGVEVGDDGEPDAAAIRAAFESVLTRFPAIKGTSAVSVGGGSNPAGAGNPGKIDVSALSPAEFAALQKRIMAGERVTL